jgi:2-hydroxycyclohexanecarboxyl-CoA dehydrogenase
VWLGLGHRPRGGRTWCSKSYRRRIGIGEAACYELARHGHRVAVLDIDAVAAQRVAETLRSYRSNAIALGVNVSDRAALEEAFARVRSELGPVTVLVTSAGKVGFGRFELISVESCQRCST